MKNSIIRQLLGMSLVVMGLVACDGGKEEGDGVATLSYEQGGEVKVDNPFSPIRGASVVIRPKTLGADQETIKIGYEDRLPGEFNAQAQSLGARKASKVLVLNRTSTLELGLAADVTIPYDKSVVGEGDIPVVLVWNDKTQTYDAAAPQSIDRSEGRITVKLAHFSKVVVAVLNNFLDPLRSLDTGFRSNDDHFFITNFGAYDYPGGSCLGMALYSGWYYHHKKPQKKAGLYSLYREGYPDKEEDDQAVRELVSHAYVRSAASWVEWGTLHEKAYSLGDFFTGSYLLGAMILTGAPQLLVFDGTSNGQTWSHAVLVYRYDADTQHFVIYDNNFPRDTTPVLLKWSPWEGFGTYTKDSYPGGIKRYAIGAMSEIYSPATFEDFYQNVEAGWPASKFPRITIQQPAPLADKPDVYEVMSRYKVIVSGSVPRASGENANIQRYAHVFVNGVGGAAPGQGKYVELVDNSGKFSFEIPDLPDPTGTDVMVLVSEYQNHFRKGFRAFKKFKVRVNGEGFFRNLGFETGGFDYWGSERHLWDGSGVMIPSDKSATVTPAYDPIATDFPIVYWGNYAARVNNYDPDYHISSVTQTGVVPDAVTPRVRFMWAAVLEDPNHYPEEQPYVDISVVNETKGTTLYRKRYFSNDPAYSGWVPYSGGNWKAIPWQLVELNLARANVGDTLRIKVEVADCFLGAHGGYAYLDGEE